MNLLQKKEAYDNTHHFIGFDIIRVALGVILFMKGVHFVGDTDSVLAMIQNSPFTAWAIIIAHYVGFAHLVGGLCIAIGFLTRIAVLFQLPILIGAVVFINAPRGIYTVGSELEYSVLVLMLLVFFLIYGSGTLSADDMIAKNKER
jgi:putative oxidoreductase